ncbi:MAG TPA: 1-acyl-sn-glycerol-3-phosphate acyltransferase [Chloroflexi bacterium]|nr:1-acyl-sn-glycerol-3-phosphate acyltransferase [Chloroflexota bacterium]
MDQTIRSGSMVDPREQKTFVFQATPVRKATIAFVRLVLPFLMTRNIRGAENLPPEGPVVLASNHLTNFDVFPIQLALPRPLFFMAKSELHKNALMDAYLRQLGAFPVQRGERDDWALAHAHKVLAQQQVLAMFPEGTRSKGRGLRPGKTGVAHFALEAGCPILPVAITGTEKVLKHFPQRAAVTVTFGEPIYPQKGENPLALTDRLMFTLAGMLPPELRGVYAERPRGFD